MNISSSAGLRVVASAWLLLTPLLGCSGGDEGGATETPTATAEPAAAPTPEPAATPEPAPEPEPAPAPAPTMVELNATVSAETPPGWVDLLHRVPTTVATTSAYRDDQSQIGRMLDRDMETAWNSASMSDGDNAPRSIYVRIPTGARVHAIELTAGFTKVTDTNDLFTANRRLRRVRVRHPGGEVLATLDIEQRGMQRIPLEGVAGDYEIQLVEWVQGTRPTWRELCISELRVMGEADASVPIGLTPTVLMSLLPAPGVDAPLAAAAEGTEADVEAAPAVPAEPDVTIAQRPGGLQITRMELAPAMDGRTPLEPRNAYYKSADDEVYCYFELNNPAATETTVTLAWEDSNGGSRGAPTEIRVAGNRRFVNYRYTSISWRRPGMYFCVVRQGTDELGRIRFSVAN